MGVYSLIALFAALAAAGLVLFQLYRRGLLTPVSSGPLDELIDAITPHTTMYVPEGDPPYPVIILLHGCGGTRPNMETYGKIASEMGVMALVPDSNAMRGISYEEALETVCTGAKLRAHERTGDLHAVLEMIRRNPRADASRIAIAGWSHGGWTALEALALDQAKQKPASLPSLPEHGLEGVCAVFAIYPYNGFPSRSRRLPWRADIPVESLLVHGDTICSETDSVDVFNRQVKWGADVKWRFIKDATHAFDEPDHHADSTLIYDPERARIAYSAFRSFLKRHLLESHGSAD